MLSAVDGPGWARRLTVADRDMTPGLLEPLMGWGASLRVWLPEWLDDPDAEPLIPRFDDVHSASKCRIGFPPSSAGGVNVTEPDPIPPVAVPIVGAPGTSTSAARPIEPSPLLAQ